MTDSVFSIKSVTNVANSFGFLDMNEKENEQKYQQIAHFLAGEVEYRIRSIVQEAQLFMKHSKRDVLTTRDINEALKMKSFPTLFGYENFETSHPFFAENISNFAKSALPRFRKVPTSAQKAGQDKNALSGITGAKSGEKNEENIYFIEDYEVDLFDFLRYKSEGDVQDAQKINEIEKAAEQQKSGTITTTTTIPADKEASNPPAVAAAPEQPLLNVKDTLSLPIAPFVLSHWLAISGIQPIIPQNPLILRNTDTAPINNPPFGEFFDKDEIEAIKSENVKDYKQKQSEKSKEKESSSADSKEKKKRRISGFGEDFGNLTNLKMKGEDEIFEANEQQNVEVKPLVKHVLSKELQMYYNRVISMFFGTNASVYQSQQDFAAKQEKILSSLRKDASIGQLVPYFTRFISYFVMNCFANLANRKENDNEKDENESKDQKKEENDEKFVDDILQQLSLVLDVTKALLMNNNIQIELYLHQLLPPILSCLLSKRVSVSRFSNHWKLRTTAAEILAILVSKYGNSFQTLLPRLTETLVSAFLNPKNLTVPANLPTTYGALKGILLALGSQVTNLYLLEPKQNSNLKVFLSMLIEKYFNVEFEGNLEAVLSKEKQKEKMELENENGNEENLEEKPEKTETFEDFFIKKQEAFQIFAVCEEFFSNYFSNLRNKILISKFSEDFVANAEISKIKTKASKENEVEVEKEEKEKEIVQILKKRLMSSSISVLIPWEDVTERYKEISEVFGDSILPSISYGTMLNSKNAKNQSPSYLADTVFL